MAYNDFSGVPLTNQITTANSAGTGLDAFDAAVSGTSAAMVASNDFTIHGKNSLKVTSGGTSSNNQIGWNNAKLGGASVNALWSQLYLYLPALPATNTTVLRFTTGSTATLCGSVLILTTGTVRFTNSGGSTINTTTSTVPTGEWFRLQTYILSSATVGQTEIKLYKGAALEDTTPTETLTSAASQNTGAGVVNEVRMPQTNSQLNFGPMYVADVNVNPTAYPAPVGTVTQDAWTYSRFVRMG